MEEVKTNRVVRIKGKELATLIRKDLKASFPGKKFSVTTERTSGAVTVRNAISCDTTIYEEDVREALHEYLAEWQRPNCGAEEMWNGNGGWEKVQYARIEEDGSITPYYYSSVHVSIYNNRQFEIDMLNAKVGY